MASLATSISIALLTVAVALAVSIPAGYALARLRVHKAKVKMEPDFAGWRVVMQTDNAAYFFVPVKVTLTPPGQETRTLDNLMNGIVVKEGDRWTMIGGLPIADRPR